MPTPLQSRAMTVLPICFLLICVPDTARTQPATAGATDPERVELAAAEYVGAVLKSGRGPGFVGVPDVHLDRRVGEPRDEAKRGRVARSGEHAARLSTALGADLIDGDSAIVCLNGASELESSAPCRFRTAGPGLIRVGAPRVEGDSAQVTVVMLRPGTQRVPIYRTTWGLHLQRTGGAWSVVPRPYSTSRS